MRIGIPKETKEGENRVAATPGAVSSLVRAGARVRVQAGAGRESGFSDREYSEVGAEMVPDPAAAWDVDLVVKVKEPLPGEFRYLTERTALFTYLHLAALPELTGELLARKVTAIAYETVEEGGRLPLLRPMSEVAGILAVQAGARGLERASGGRGVLLSPVPGAEPASVCVIGAGISGKNAARTAAALGAGVALLDLSEEKLAAARKEIGPGISTMLSSPEAIESAAVGADLVVCAVLVPGGRAPILIRRGLLRRMKRGAVVVDVSIDQGGTLETSRPTTHASPFYVEEGVVHYCVANMPAAVPRTSTGALSGAILPYLLRIARSGVAGAMREDPGFRRGLNTLGGSLTCEGVAHAFGKPYRTPEEALGF